jgi:ADP-ribose pyrophosphatase YjhB (NUDIX family)
MPYSYTDTESMSGCPGVDYANELGGPKTYSMTRNLWQRMGRTIPERLWKSILVNMPIACVDVIVHRRIKHQTRVLLGYRKIYPYRNRWALPGGRIIKRETLCDTANRQLEEIGLRPTGKYRLVGVYPVNFKHRSDISICLSSYLPTPQEPQATRELSRYAWSPLNSLPPRLGSNYKAMLRDFKCRPPGAQVTSTHYIG